MTRAMDHLGVFTLEDPKSPAIRNLVSRSAAENGTTT
jgi:hypothetical protein